jgi:hypothetical protein
MKHYGNRPLGWKVHILGVVRGWDELGAVTHRVKMTTQGVVFSSNL